MRQDSGHGGINGRQDQKEPGHRFPGQVSPCPEQKQHQGQALLLRMDTGPNSCVLAKGSQDSTWLRLTDKPGRVSGSDHRRLAHGLWVLQAANDAQGPDRHQAWLLRSQMTLIGEVEQETAGVGAWAWALTAQTPCC